MTFEDNTNAIFNKHDAEQNRLLANKYKALAEQQQTNSIRNTVLLVVVILLVIFNIYSAINNIKTHVDAGKRFTYCDGIILAETLDLIPTNAECIGQGHDFTKVLQQEGK
jgi:hypothetical protein